MALRQFQSHRLVSEVSVDLIRALGLEPPLHIPHLIGFWKGQPGVGTAAPTRMAQNQVGLPTIFSEGVESYPILTGHLQMPIDGSQTLAFKMVMTGLTFEANAMHTSYLATEVSLANKAYVVAVVSPSSCSRAELAREVWMEEKDFQGRGLTHRWASMPSYP